ncbi:hypothetical protein CVT26_003214 [Gymnopilus dilepis]|uniref:DUF6534 domain-containing protein n=1 Tax=Gymnopilus dilepis TaxID=231916 RepID=A0A409Y5C9_9AGAR|nr:hypothetical protein CVT26_003214 [Gymnopilus dilepis]
MAPANLSIPPDIVSKQNFSKQGVVAGSLGQALEHSGVSDLYLNPNEQLIGYILHWGLFGVLSAQVCTLFPDFSFIRNSPTASSGLKDIYFLAFPSDPMRNKFFVYSVYFLEVLQTGIITASAFHVFGSGFGDYALFDRVELAWFSVPIISGLVALLADTFYAYRISILAETYWVSGVVSLLAVMQFVGSIAQGVEIKQIGLFSELLGTQFSIATAFWNGSSALCDVIIAVCMTYYLSRRGSELGMPSTQRLLRRVMTLIIGSGVVTASIAILNLILTAFPGHPGYFVASAEILAKVYSNSMMVLLNRRMEIRPESTRCLDNTTWSSMYPEIRIDVPEANSTDTGTSDSNANGGDAMNWQPCMNSGDIICKPGRENQREKKGFCGQINPVV